MQSEGIDKNKWIIHIYHQYVYIEVRQTGYIAVEDGRKVGDNLR